MDRVQRFPRRFEAEVDESTFADIIKLRRSFLPGHVSLAIIKGRSSLSWEEKLYYDRLYISKLSTSPFTTDLKILALTFSALIRSDIYDN